MPEHRTFDRRTLAASVAQKTSEQLRKRIEQIAPLIGTEYEDDYPEELDIILKELAFRGAL